jgi:YHS domain-containing protein
MGRIFVIAILVWIAYFLVKKIGRALLASSSLRDQARGPASDTELIRDPQCGAYFLKQKGVKGVVEGQVIHFCSEQCYDNYLKSRSHN